jgi:hypothetical protein
MAAVYWVMDVHVTPNWGLPSGYDCLDDSVVGGRPDVALPGSSSEHEEQGPAIRFFLKNHR